MRRLVVAALTVSCAAFIAANASAQTQPDAVLALHLQPVSAKGKCDTASPNGQGIPCTAYTVEGAVATNLDCYLVVGNGLSSPGIAGLSCGIEYQSVDLFADWTLCADLEFPNAAPGRDSWPDAGGGNRITWTSSTNCQREIIGGAGVHAIAGAFYLYAYNPTTFKITPNRNLQSGAELLVADCQARETDIDSTGTASAMVGFGGETGTIVCVTIPVEETTWGQIKNKFNPN